MVKGLKDVNPLAVSPELTPFNRISTPSLSVAHCPMIVTRLAAVESVKVVR